MKHSNLIGGSTASRRINCPASYALEKRAPKQDGSTYAREGTALHDVIARRMAHRFQDGAPVDLTEDYLYTDEDGWTYDLKNEVIQEEIGNAEAMLDNFVEMNERETGDTFRVLGIEEMLEFPMDDMFTAGEAFGTSDLVFVCGDTFGIIDWKFGRRPVSPEQSAQLLYYACCAFAHHKAKIDVSKIKHISLNIGQPRTDHAIKEWRTDVPDLRSFVEEVNQATKEMTSPNPHMETGDWCQYAPCRSICPLHTQAVATIATDVAVLNEPPEEFDGAGFFGTALPIADIAERWVASIRDAAQAHVAMGGLIPEYEMLPKKSIGRVWNPEVTEQQRVGKLRRLGLKADDYSDRVFLSPAKVEKVLKARKEKLPDGLAVMKPSSGFTLKRTTNTEEYAAIDRDAAMRLGTKLNALLGEN